MKERRAAQGKQITMAAEEEMVSQLSLQGTPQPLAEQEEPVTEVPLQAEDEHLEAEKVDKQPFNPVELDADDNPGQALRMAREQAGLSMEEIGALTKINERQLEAIESGDPSRLPPETFAKAFIKSYCRVLNIDPRPIIQAFGFAETKAMGRTGPAVGQQVRLESLESQGSSGAQILSNARLESKTSGRRSLVYGLVLAAFGLMAAFYVPVFLANRNVDGAAEQQASALPVVQEPEPLPDGFDPNQMADAHGQPLDLANPTAEAGAYAATPGAAEPAFPALAQGSAQTTTQAPTGIPAISTAPPVSPSPAVPAPVAAAPVVAAPAVTAPVGSAPVPQVASKVAPAATPSLGAGQAVLRFAFTGQSWLTVWDGNNQVLVSQDNMTGSAVVLKGKGPFKVFVGKPKLVSLNANGNAVALVESSPGGVARLVLR